MSAPQKVVIETPRLLLSDFRVTDFAAFSRFFDDLQQSGQGWFSAQAEQPETIRNFFAKILDNQQDTPRHTYRLAVRLKGPSSETAPAIGYVSLCDIYSHDEGKPDTGILIDPKFQGDGYAREARVAIGYFGLQLGLERLVCDIKQNNFVSINNVIAMGYEQVVQDEEPLVIETSTVRGIEDWYRYRITREQFLDKLPHLLDGLAQRHWRGSASEICDTKKVDDIIKITPVSETADKSPNLPESEPKSKKDEPNP